MFVNANFVAMAKIFLLGGRCSTVPLRDFWTFDLGKEGRKRRKLLHPLIEATCQIGPFLQSIIDECMCVMIDSGLWTSLLARGTPVNVQEHSMIHWNDCLYVFGGVFAQAGECPLWIYQIQVILMLSRNTFHHPSHGCLTT